MQERICRALERMAALLAAQPPHSAERHIRGGVVSGTYAAHAVEFP